MIELWADVELKDTIVVAMPKLAGRGSIREECPKNIGSGEAKNLKNPSQAPRGVPVKNDLYLGTNDGTSNLASKEANPNRSLFWNMETSSTSITHIVDKIRKPENLIIDGKVTLVDDEGKPWKRVDHLGDHDIKDKVESVDNDMARFLVSERVGFGTNSWMEQWRNTYKNDDYDYGPYDDDMYERQEIPNKIQSICDNLDIKVRGRKKK
ncbi:hypothetical protein Tco_1356408 [Tanacetum coccineum]